MKKKNLLKCLALTSMLALSVGAVTSCGTQGKDGATGAQGPKGDTGAAGATGATGAKGDKGDKGDTGATGATGAQGEKGDTGAKGDTYYPVVILADGVKTDKISGMEGEEYTLTFTVPSGKMVSELKINYEDVDIEKVVYGETITYTGTFGSTINGAVIVSTASFDSIDTYLKLLLNEHLAEILAKDNQIYVDEVADVIEYPDGIIHSQYTAAAKGAQKALDKAVTNIADAYKGLKSTATVSEKIAAARAYVKTSNKAMDDAYDKDVIAAKAAALVSVTGLDTALVNTNFAKTDRDAILAEAKTAIEGATTIQALAEIVNSALDANSKVIGEYNKLYERKESAFGDIVDALGTIENTFDGAEEHEEALTALKAQLAELGISVDELPTEIAKKWNTKISAARYNDLGVYTAAPATGSTETYSVGDVIMGYEGAKEVKASYTDLKDKVVAALLKNYYDEIEASKKLDSNGKIVMKGVVSSAINTWIDAREGGVTPAYISAYVSPEQTLVSGSGVATTASGLVGYIEGMLSKQIEIQPAYSTFAAERLNAALNDTYAALKAESDKVMASDKVYAGLLPIKRTKDSTTGDDDNSALIMNNYYGDYMVGKKTTTPAIDGTIENPLFATMNGTVVEKGGNPSNVFDFGATVTGYYVDGLTAIDSTNGLGDSEVKADNYIASEFLDKIAPVNASGVLETTLGAKILGNVKTIVAAKQVKADFLGKFEALHTSFVKHYLAAQESEQFSTDFLATGNKYIKGETGVAMINSFVESKLPQKDDKVDFASTTMTDISNAVYDVLALQEQINTVDSKLVSWVASKDDVMLNTLLSDEDSVIYKAVLDETSEDSIISKVLAGSYATTQALKDAMDALLDGIYNSSVAETLVQYKALFNNVYIGYLRNTTAANAPKVKATYDAWVKMAGGEDYPCDTFAGIADWYNTGIRRLDVATGSLTYVLPAVTGQFTGDSNGYTLTDNTGNYAIASTNTNNKYDQEIAITEITGKDLVPETDNTAGNLFPTGHGFQVGDNLYLVSFSFAGAIGSGTFTDNGYIKVPAVEEESGYKTIKLTATSHAGWNDMLIAVNGAKDFVIEYSYDGITTYRVHVTIDAAILPAA